MGENAMASYEADAPSGPEPRSLWPLVKFGDVVECTNYVERDPLGAGVERYVGLEHIEPECLHIKNWGLVKDGTSFTRKFVKGQVLFGKRRAYQRKVAVAEFDGICSSDILTFQPRNDELIPELLPFIVQSDGFFDHALGTSAGSLSPRTKWSQLKEYSFPLPPKDEQRRIADILWAAEEVVSEYSLSQRKGAILLNVLRHSLIMDDKDALNPLWRRAYLREIVELWSGQHVESRYCDSGPEGVPYLTGPADFPDGAICVTKYTKRPKVLCQSGDVLVTVKGSGAGKVVRADRPYCISRQLMAARPSEADPDFVYSVLKSYSEELNRMADGVIPGITREQLLSTAVLVPPREEQQQIGRCLAAFERTLEELAKHVLNSKRLRNEITSHLMPQIREV